MYVDGFLLAVKAGRIEDYRKMAEGAKEIWMKHGALSYVEAVGDDLAPKMPEPPPGVDAPAMTMKRFGDVVGAGEGETVVFAFITFKDRAHRDEVNAKVMADPSMAEACAGMDMTDMPMDMARMAYGGFRAIVSG